MMSAPIPAVDLDDAEAVANLVERFAVVWP